MVNVNLPIRPPSNRRSTPEAFSLVEVAMSLGIFAFAMMGLVGLLPVAMNTHKEAKTSTVLSQIQQRLAAEVLLTDGAKLAQLQTDWQTSPRLFDAEGGELQANEGTQAVYRAKIEIQNFQPPGASAASSSLQRVVFFAVQDPGGNLLASAKASGSLLVAKAESAQESSGN